RLLAVDLDDRDDSMLSGDTFQPVCASILEADPRTARELARGHGGEHRAGFGDRGDPRADVHGDAADPAVSILLDLAEMHPGADLEADVPHGSRRLERGPQRGGRCVEDGEHPLPGPVDPSTALPAERT